MNLLNRSFLSYSIAIIVAALVSVACRSDYDGRFALSGNEKRYELRGKVVSVDKAQQTVTLAHEEVKDLMPPMTMPFTMKDQWPYDMLVPGQQLTATLIVDDTRSWIQDVVVTSEAESDPGKAGSNPAVAEARPGDEVPNYGLVNQDEKRIKIHNYRGKVLLLTFIYTRCPLPEYCSLMSDNFAKIEKELEAQKELLQKTHLLSISIDPEYDTPAVLRSYGAAHSGRYSDEKFNHWEFAGGTKDEVKGIAQFFGLHYYSGEDQIIHDLRTVIIDPNGRVFKVYRDNKWKPEEVVKDLQAALGPVEQ
jgi:protein SCO1/2